MVECMMLSIRVAKWPARWAPSMLVLRWLWLWYQSCAYYCTCIIHSKGGFANSSAAVSGKSHQHTGPKHESVFF